MARWLFRSKHGQTRRTAPPATGVRRNVGTGEYDRSRLPGRRRRRHGHGVRRHAAHRHAGHGRLRRRGPPARRPLARDLPVRPAAPAVGLLRRELPPVRRRRRRLRRMERGLLRTRQRQRGVRLLRPGDAPPPRAHRAADLPADDALPRRPPPPHARRGRTHRRGATPPRRRHLPEDHGPVDASPAVHGGPRRRGRHAQRPARAGDALRPLHDRRRGQDRHGCVPVVAAQRNSTRAGALDHAARLLADEPRDGSARAAVPRRGPGRDRRPDAGVLRGHLRRRPLRTPRGQRQPDADRHGSRTHHVPLRHRVRARAGAAAPHRRRGAARPRRAD